MPRTGRLILPDLPHHIVQRGHNRQTVFASPADCHYYLDILQEFSKALDIKVYAFCLMTNHVHLLLGKKRGQIYFSTQKKGTDLFFQVEIAEIRKLAKSP